MLGTLLTEEGYRVDGAADGQRALHLELTHRYDVIVLDRRLPAIEGLDVIGRWRRHGVSTPVLVLSAWDTAADRVAGLDAGAEDYLTKPYDIDELLARLRALRKRQLDVARQPPVGDARLDLDTREVVPNPTSATTGRPPVRLSERECELLPWPGSRGGCSSGTTCSARSSPRPAARSSSTPMCITCGASWAGMWSRPCTGAVTGSAGAPDRDGLLGRRLGARPAGPPYGWVCRPRHSSSRSSYCSPLRPSSSY